MARGTRACLQRSRFLLSAPVKQLRFFVAVLALAAVVGVLQAQAPGPQNGIAALVDERVITFEDVLIFTRTAREAADRQLRRNPVVNQQKQVEIQRAGLEELIERQLILAEFKRAGYNFPESLIDDFVKSRIRDQFGDRLTLTKTLQATGETYEDYRQRERENLIISQMRIKNIASQIIISPKKIESYYQANRDKYQMADQAKLRMIILNASRRPAGETRRLAEQIVKDARAGTKFADLANKHSDDAARYKGGDRGWVEDKESDLRRELREVAFKLKAGETSEPVEVENIFFIMQVEETKAAGLRPLNDVRQEIELALRSQEVDRLRSNWTKKLRNKSFVRYF